MRTEGWLHPSRRIGRTMSLRTRVTLLAAFVVTIAVALMAGAAFSVVARALYSDVDDQLRKRVDLIVASHLPERFGSDAVTAASLFSDTLSGTLIYPDNTAAPMSPLIELGEPEFAVIRGEQESSLRTIGNRRVIAQRSNQGATLVLAQDLAPTQEVLDRLALVLLIVGGCGVILAVVAGTGVGRTGLRPVARLTAAAQRVARTDDLTPIPVTGDDELARLTEAFNSMLLALRESRERQSRLVADAGHELRTPLTSLRTNTELLIAASRQGAPALAPEDMEGLQEDVLAQIEELSTLVGDLVDLAREDSTEPGMERVDIAEIADRAIERVRRRRTDVEIDASTLGWWVWGDAGGLTRALLNVLDNAAKWSPPEGRITLRMQPGRGRNVDVTIEDEGPGIPLEERALVFERFYRSDASRSMPGSGLGLAIVYHVLHRHGGKVTIDDADGGGARVTLSIPGEPVEQ